MVLGPKDVILNSAIKLFSEKGFDATSVDEIAKDANVNKAMIYYYFSSKEGLLNSIIRKSVNDFTSIVEKIEVTKYSSLCDLIRDIVNLAVEYIDSNFEMIRIFFREGLVYRDRIGTTIHETISLVFESVISKVRTKFDIPDEFSFVDQVVMTNLIVGIIDLRLRFSGKEEEGYSVIKSQYVDKVSKMLCSLVGG